MALPQPWQTAEVSGPTRANVITKPEIIIAMIKKAERPLLVVGHKVAEGDSGGEEPIDYVIRIAKSSRIPVVATAHLTRGFLERGFQPDASMPVVDIGNRLVDPNWKGLRNEGQHDLVLIVGVPYYMEWLVLSALKHFASDLKSICMDRFYQPNATWSFPNISVEDWQKSLKLIAERMGGN